MLRQTFLLNEDIQALDPQTFIWENAKIIGFESDWCVRIRWVDWSGKTKSKAQLTVPEDFRECQVSTIAIIQKIHFVIKFEI